MKAYVLLDSPDKWTNGISLVNALDAEGSQVSSLSSLACKWNLVGALEKCYIEDPWNTRDFEMVYFRLRREVGPLGSWLMQHTYEETVALLRERDL